LEKVGVEKRDILIDRVENAKDSQQNAQKQFSSALEQLTALIYPKSLELQLGGKGTQPHELSGTK
jgi:predicted metal-dependent hydrolase